MNKEDTFTIMKDMFGKKGSEEQVEGLTLIIDGKLKEVFDTIIGKLVIFSPRETRSFGVFLFVKKEDNFRSSRRKESNM